MLRTRSREAVSSSHKRCVLRFQTLDYTRHEHEWREAVLPNDKQAPRELKVTDKRIFTPEGEIRDEFKTEIKPAEPQAARAAEPLPQQTPAQPSPKTDQASSEKSQAERRSAAGKGEDPGTPFSDFIRGLIAQAYMFLGMLRDPYSTQPPRLDAVAARQMIDIVSMLSEKTAGNLTPEEAKLLQQSLMHLRMTFVQAVEKPLVAPAKTPEPPAAKPVESSAAESAKPEAPPAAADSGESESRKRFSKKF